MILLQGCQPIEHTFHGSPYPELKIAPNFQLTQTSGEILSFPADLDGISLLFFGYTYCPDVCPGTAAQMKWVFEQLDESAIRVNFIFVTVDPGRDTPDIIEKFLSRFSPAFIGLRGDQTELEPIKQAYGVLDQEKYLRTGYPFGTSSEEILSDLKYLLGASS
jgi:protein SCO1/2